MGLRKWLRSHKKNIEVNGEGNVFVNVPRRVRIRCCGTNNRVEFVAPVNSNFAADITIGVLGCPVHDCVVLFKADASCAQTRIMIMESDSRLIVGEGARIADQTEIWLTDTHAILDAEGNLLNRGREVVIGKHTWICTRAIIMKNTTVPDNCIVAYGAIVAGTKNVPPNSVLAGNPARVVKTNVFWSEKRPEAILKEKGLV